MIYTFSHLNYKVLQSKSIIQDLPKSVKKNGQIGRGTFGIVFKIKSVQDGKIYAQKKFIRGRNQQEPFRIQRQIIHNKKLKHENLVEYIKSFQVTVQEGFSFTTLIQQYCQSNLNQQYQQICSLQQYQKVKLLIQLSRGIAEMHNNFIIHRDLKPSNILIKHVDTENFLLKICDFGQSIMQEGLKDTMANQGTVLYQAPELLNYNIEEVNVVGGKSADIFSFGLIAYEIITGHHLYGSIKVDRANEAKKAQSQFFDKFDKYFQNLPCSYDLKMIIRACLLKDPDRRIKTNELLKKLQAIKFNNSTEPSSIQTYTQPLKLFNPNQITEETILAVSILQLYSQRNKRLLQTKAYAKFIQTLAEYNQQMKDITIALNKLGDNCRVRYSLQILFYIIICYYFKFLKMTEKKIIQKNQKIQLVIGVPMANISLENRGKILKLLSNQIQERQKLFIKLKEECLWYSNIKGQSKYTKNLYLLIKGQKPIQVQDINIQSEPVFNYQSEQIYSDKTNPMDFLDGFTDQQIQQQQKKFFNYLVNGKQFSLGEKQRQICAQIQKLFLRFRGALF